MAQREATWNVIGSYRNAVEAGLAQSLLEAAGIEAWLPPTLPVASTYADATRGVQLWVHPGDEARAREALAVTVSPEELEAAAASGGAELEEPAGVAPESPADLPAPRPPEGDPAHAALGFGVVGLFVPLVPLWALKLSVDALGAKGGRRGLALVALAVAVAGLGLHAWLWSRMS